MIGFLVLWSISTVILGGTCSIIDIFPQSKGDWVLLLATSLILSLFGVLFI